MTLEVYGMYVYLRSEPQLWKGNPPKETEKESEAEHDA